VPTSDRVDIVRFTGGEHHGLVVEAPAAVAAQLHAMKFEVLASGRLYDVARQRRIPGARVLAEPPAPPIAPPPPEPVAVVVPADPPPAPRRTDPIRQAPGAPVFRPARPR
jgi:hypothetical protein